MRIYTKCLVLLSFVLMIAGGLVTSTKSGLAVPDWPLSYGQLMPPMVGGVRFEHSHRMIASAVGFMTLLLCFWAGFVEKRKWFRLTTIVALGAVVIQGILGGMTVLFLLPPPISIFHACLAQSFFSLTVALAYFASREWREAKPDTAKFFFPILNHLVVSAACFVFIQIFLGAAIRHAENRMLVIPHIAGAFLVLLHALMIAGFVLKNKISESKLVTPAVFFAFLAILQMGFGSGAFIFRFMLEQREVPPASNVFFLTVHQSLGAVVFATIVFLALRISRLGGFNVMQSVFQKDMQPIVVRGLKS